MKNIYKVNEEAVKKIAERVYDNGSTVINRNDLEEMFPELAESGDERIRKELVDFLEYYRLNNVLDSKTISLLTDSVAWLEKQGEQKPVDLALYNDLKPWEKPEYIIKAINRKRVEPALKGDALHKFKNELNSLKQILHLLYDGYNNPVNYRLALHWASWGAQSLQGYFGINKEEREKMDDVTSEQKPINNQFTPEQADILDKHIDEFIKQKPTWSEEDKIRMNNLLSFLDKNGKEYYGQISLDVTKDWLKSLKDRVQRKQEWSEEDKAILEKCIGAVKVSCYSYSFKSEAENWLKSLRPQNTLKPSEEQMKGLRWVFEFCNTSHQTNVLKELYEQLKQF